MHIDVDFGQHEKWSMDPRLCQMSTPLTREMVWVYSSFKWAPEFSGFQQYIFNFFVLVDLLSRVKHVHHFLLEAMLLKSILASCAIPPSSEFLWDGLIITLILSSFYMLLFCYDHRALICCWQCLTTVSSPVPEPLQ